VNKKTPTKKKNLCFFCLLFVFVCLFVLFYFVLFCFFRVHNFLLSPPLPDHFEGSQIAATLTGDPSFSLVPAFLSSQAMDDEWWIQLTSLVQTDSASKTELMK